MQSVLSAVLLSVLVAIGGCTRATTADLILTDAVVRTMDANRTVAEAVAVRDGRIVFVGTASDAKRYRGDETRVFALGGKLVLPGFVDAHAHLLGLGNSLAQLKLVGTSSPGEIRQMVVEAQKQVAAGEWIQGRGWDQNDWQETVYPTWRDLDGTEANPVYLRRVDGHAAWANRKALEMCGIDEATADPFGGKVMRDADGRPTGILIDEAMELVRPKIPESSIEEKTRRIRAAVRECNRHGLTGMHDAGTEEDDLGILRDLRRRNELTLRVYCMLSTAEDSTFTRDLMRSEGVDGDSFVTVRSIKLYADGALGSRGAALLEPYTDDPGNKGLLQRSRPELTKWTRDAVQNGFQVCTHAIGDAGNRLTIDVYEEVLNEMPRPDHRLRIEHAQVMALDDIARMAKFGIVASMQPTHATSDMYWAEDRVGAERIKGAYAWRKFIEAGCIVANGSDFPVEGVNPLWGVYAAVTRQDDEGWPNGGWYSEERMTVDEAVAGFTTNAAYAEFAESRKGSIEVGKLADLVVLDGDIFAIPASEILATGVVYTIVDGRVVFSAVDDRARRGSTK
jgi:predicted amidohydrolase YtcJ